ncbi:glycoside hydrolase family 3 C-terminal domain-containing protein [Dictyobacter kobayashii]|uniref:Beta-glucosidase n=1 Tax=Dictyobacter kobayashii TaxID=2014872 RepID=A0A402AW84_9CHLR|nr:glycoside hydrolase family 3 C-terminal domain-containing protein [Dictyobacter kobayashii]GCE23401.1 beta-glucosidase [Dictyobacter kobayashii]
MHAKVEDLLGKMTLEEKVSLLAGASMWNTIPIERLGIPSLKVSDGPNGARGESNPIQRDDAGVTSACFPAGISLAATWNPALIERIGQALGQEAKSKGARVLLAPTVNIHRSPLNGRNFECYSEDPYLSARMAVGYIKGVQSEDVGATVKHFVCNDSEFQRNSISSEVGERALREIYLPPFKAAIQEAGSWLAMASYNKINGTYASENPYTLTDILKKEWGFDGVVMSDWFGTQSTVPSINAGLDLEMPGPAIWRGEKLLQAVKNGEVAESTIDDSVSRLLHLFIKVGLFEVHEDGPEQALDLPEHRALIREAGAEGCVLLKNERDILPLQPEKLQSIAIIGPNARTARMMGGGSALVNAHYSISPYDAIVERVGDQLSINDETNFASHNLLPLIDQQLFSSHDGDTTPGFAIEYFQGHNFTAKANETDHSASSEKVWFGVVADNIDPLNFSARFTAHIRPQKSGTHQFSLASAGLSKLYIDSKELINNWDHQLPGQTYFGMGSQEVIASIELTAGQDYQLAIEYTKGVAAISLAAVRVGLMAPVSTNALERAVALAANSDVALVFAGLNGEWESEGFDRPNMDLMAEQVELIEKVAEANKNTIVVLNTGSPITMPWLDKVPGVLQCWYPGQECGNAIADVLFGTVNPSGKLPQTFPQRIEDNPAYINYPGENGRVHYGEGLFVGYRYYDKKKVAPLFPFGFGLSYTTFSYNPSIQLNTQSLKPNDTLQAAIRITNTGQRAGKEVVQLYVRDLKSTLQRPEKELKAFAKLHLEPGESQTVTFELERAALAYYDDLAHQWVAEAGEFEVLIGSSAQDIHARATFTLTETSHFGERIETRQNSTTGA